MAHGQRINYDGSVPEYDQPWRFSTKQFDAETGLGYWGYRYYSPGLGRWISRDPMAEIGGINLSLFVRNCPIGSVDALGLWRQAVHAEMTRRMAALLGLACLDELADDVLTPDRDWDAPALFLEAQSLLFQAQLVRLIDPARAAQLEERARALMAVAQYYHFPAEPNGEVGPGGVSDDELQSGCSLSEFGQQLHRLQDSFAHRERTVINGVGHSRGAINLLSVIIQLTDLLAALSDSADDPALCPASAREAALATYNAIADFIDQCPCACHGEPTCGGERIGRTAAEAVVRLMYPGDEDATPVQHNR